MNPENGKLIENAGMRPVAGTAPWTSAHRSSVDATGPMPPIIQGTGLVYLPSMELCHKYSCQGHRI